MTRFFALVLAVLSSGLAYEAMQSFRPFDLGVVVDRWWLVTCGMMIALSSGWRP